MNTETLFQKIKRIAFKEEDVRRIRMAPHPLEFEMYYSL